MQYYINKLIDNLQPHPISNINNIVDIVFEGGLFNGSYLIGALYYLKQLEERKIIKINRISGCSIGALISLIYYSNNYELSDIIYKITYRHFKKKLNVNIFEKIFENIRPYITDEIMKKINGTFYITYYNIKQNKQMVKNAYKDVDDLFEIIRRSCHCPYVIDNSFLYKDKYADGFFPFIFNDDLTISNKILYLNIHNFDKLSHSISIKNEKTNYGRIFYGILDIHTFFMTNHSTSMCSYVNEWSTIEKIKNWLFIYILKMITHLMHKIYVLNKIITISNTKHYKRKNNKNNNKNNQNKYIDNSNNSTDYQNFLHSLYLYILKTYCI